MRHAAFLALLLAALCAQAQDSADGWITHAAARDRTPGVLHFRPELLLDEAPKSLPVEVTADNRFVLFVNGARVASGPSAGTLQRWRVSRGGRGAGVRGRADRVGRAGWGCR